MIWVCAYDGCGLPAESNRLCVGHRTQQRRNGGNLRPLRLKRPDHCHVRACNRPSSTDIPGWCAEHLVNADPAVWDAANQHGRAQVATTAHHPCADVHGFTELPITEQAEVCTGCSDRTWCLDVGITEAERYRGITWTYGGLTPAELYAYAAPRPRAADRHLGPVLPGERTPSHPGTPGDLASF